MSDIPSNDDNWDEAQAAVVPWIRKSNVAPLPDITAEHTDGFMYALDFHQFPPGFRNT